MTKNRPRPTDIHAANLGGHGRQQPPLPGPDKNDTVKKAAAQQMLPKEARPQPLKPQAPAQGRFGGHAQARPAPAQTRDQPAQGHKPAQAPTQSPADRLKKLEQMRGGPNRDRSRAPDRD